MEDKERLKNVALQNVQRKTQTHMGIWFHVEGHDKLMQHITLDWITVL